VTGSLGGSGFGRHLDFEPRVAEALRLARMVGINSMIDISDGLSTDLNRICKASGVGAMIEAESIPISQEAERSIDPLQAALNEGEDFELLFTLSQEDCAALMEEWREPTPITKIGSVTDSRRMQIRVTDGRLEDLEAGGYEHLKD